jgi:hypothetical protein
VGFLLIPVMIVVSVLPFVHAGYAAYKVSQGDEYRYPVAAGLARDARRVTRPTRLACAPLVVSSS